MLMMLVKTGKSINKEQQQQQQQKTLSPYGNTKTSNIEVNTLSIIYCWNIYVKILNYYLFTILIYRGLWNPVNSKTE